MPGMPSSGSVCGQGPGVAGEGRADPGGDPEVVLRIPGPYAGHLGKVRRPEFDLTARARHAERFPDVHTAADGPYGRHVAGLDEVLDRDGQVREDAPQVFDALLPAVRAVRCPTTNRSPASRTLVGTPAGVSTRAPPPSGTGSSTSPQDGPWPSSRPHHRPPARRRAGSRRRGHPGRDRRRLVAALRVSTGTPLPRRYRGVTRVSRFSSSRSGAAAKSTTCRSTDCGSSRVEFPAYEFDHGRASGGAGEARRRRS